MFRLVLVCVLWCFTQIGTVFAQEPIDKDTIAAYEKLGAVYGGFESVGCGYLSFSQGAEAASKGLPGFKFQKLPEDGLSKLPAVKVPFGVDLWFTSVTDAGVKELANLKQLTTLNLGGARGITDAGVKELVNFKQLSTLDLRFTQVTDTGLKELANLKQLTTLNLENMQLTNAGLKELANLKQLTSLYLGATRVTDAGLKELREALPKCQIFKY